MDWLPAKLPALIMGMLVGAYWARVVRLVLKARRRAGHTANFLPPEPLGRWLRLAWYPVVGAWILLPWLRVSGIGLDSPLLHPLFRQPVVHWMAVIGGLLAFGATLVCWKRMGRSWRMGINPEEKTELVVTGPYAYVRHPIYALSSLLMLATWVAVPTPSLLVIALAHLLLLQWEARREERYLAQSHGEAYGAYCQSVNRFIPRLGRSPLSSR